MDDYLAGRFYKGICPMCTTDVRSTINCVYCDACKMRCVSCGAAKEKTGPCCSSCDPMGERASYCQRCFTGPAQDSLSICGECVDVVMEMRSKDERVTTLAPLMGVEDDLRVTFWLVELMANRSEILKRMDKVKRGEPIEPLGDYRFESEESLIVNFQEIDREIKNELGVDNDNMNEVLRRGTEALSRLQIFGCGVRGVVEDKFAAQREARQVDDLKLEIDRLKVERDEVRRQRNEARRDRESAREERNNLRKELAEVMRGCEQLTIENIQVRKENEEIRNENEKLKSENEKLKGENEKLKSENEKLKEENESLRSGCIEARKRIEEIEDKIDNEPDEELGIEDRFLASQLKCHLEASKREYAKLKEKYDSKRHTLKKKLEEKEEECVRHQYTIARLKCNIESLKRDGPNASIASVNNPKGPIDYGGVDE